jgi:carbonic anhydrase
MCDDREPIRCRPLMRRDVLAMTTGLAGSALVGLLPGRAVADECAPFLAPALAATSPDHAVELLVEGNARFVADASLHCDLLDDVAATAEGQTPFACVLGCIDSRVSPELVFDQQIGDIFVDRIAGNLPTVETIGGFEYAAKVAGAKAIVVLGHSHCGAVKGAVDKVDVGENLSVLLAEIEPAIAATPLTGERSSGNHAFVQAVAEMNVRLAVAAIIDRSEVIRALVAAGSLRVVGAMYDVETGVVRFLD